MTEQYEIPMPLAENDEKVTTVTVETDFGRTIRFTDRIETRGQIDPRIVFETKEIIDDNHARTN